MSLSIPSLIVALDVDGSFSPKSIVWFIVIDDGDELLTFAFVVSPYWCVLSAWGVPIGDVNCWSFVADAISPFDDSSSAAIAESKEFGNTLSSFLLKSVSS